MTLATHHLSITFKVVQTYSDGEVVRWIELTGADGREPDNPAPIVKLSSGAASAISPAPANDTAPHSGALARTGAGDRVLALAAGLSPGKPRGFGGVPR
jgi:hypothetical protein